VLVYVILLAAALNYRWRCGAWQKIHI